MICLASDHAAYERKKEVIQYLLDSGYEVKDVGTFDSNSCDYPLFAIEAAECVASGKAQYGILLCGTGIGMSIAANKVRGVRCAVCQDLFSAQMTRKHNDANMLALGARVISPELTLQIVQVFLSTEYEGGRHDKRLDIISQYENKDKS